MKSPTSWNLNLTSLTVNAISLIALVIVLILGGCSQMSQTLLEPDPRPYDFRRTRWGYTKEMVMATEQGKRLHVKKGNVLIYNHAFGHVPWKVIYCFQDNKLRAAGYITDKPVGNVENIMNLSTTQHGEPTEERHDGMRWDLERTIIYSNAYVSRLQERGVPQWEIGGGITEHLYKPQEEQPGLIRHWDGIWAYVDRNLYDQLHDERFPLDELSFYEKMLFGVVKRQAKYSGATNTIRGSFDDR